MYETMTNKNETPTFDDLLHFCGESGELLTNLEKYLEDELIASKQIRYGHFGWSVKYSIKTRHICYAVAENGAFQARFKISNKAMGTVYDKLGPYAKNIWENGYDCGSGKWINVRVLNDEHLQDLKKILRAKIITR